MYKQLTKEDRLRIYEGLNRNESLSEIGRAIGKNRSTVVREIKRNREAKPCSYTGRTKRCARKKEECLTEPVLSELFDRKVNVAFSDGIYTAFC